MKFFIDAAGKIQGVYVEAMDYEAFGKVESIRRASTVDYLPAFRHPGWYATIPHSESITILGPFTRRSEAIQREVEFLEQQMQQRKE